MEVNVNVEVGLKEATIQRLAAIFGAPQTRPMQAPAAPVLPPKPKEDPKPEPAPEPKAPEIDNLTLNKAVKDAQARGIDAEVIRGVFTKYGIKSSRDCPTDKRAALLAELNDLDDLPL